MMGGYPASAAVNTLENFAPVFNKQLETLFIERMDDNEGTLHAP